MITTLLDPLRAHLSAEGWIVIGYAHWRIDAQRGPILITVEIDPHTFLWRASYARIEGLGTRKHCAERRATEGHATPDGAFYDVLESL